MVLLQERTWRQASSIGFWSVAAFFTSRDLRCGPVISSLRRSCLPLHNVAEFPEPTGVLLPGTSLHPEYDARRRRNQSTRCRSWGAKASMRIVGSSPSQADDITNTADRDRAMYAHGFRENRNETAEGALIPRQGLRGYAVYESRPPASRHRLHGADESSP
jgi:hypothetical protein